MPEQEQNQPQAPNTTGGQANATATERGQEAAGPGPEEEALGNQVTAVKADKIPVLRTLKSDISEYVKSRNISLAEIAAESSKQRRFGEETNQPKKFLILMAGIILAAAGLAIGGYLIFFREKPAAGPAPGLQTPKSLVFSEKREIVTLTSESPPELIGSAQKSLQSPIPINTILDIPILEKTPQTAAFLDASNFFRILKIIPPVNFTQSLEGPFTLGVFYFKKNTPFLIFKISSYDLAFSGMLSWERNLARDLKEILLLKNIPPAEQKFKDGIIKNRDVRVLYDESDNPVIIYAFINRRYLIITSDTDTLEEIINRFSTFPQS